MDHVPFFTGGVTESAYKWEIPYSYSLSFLYNDRLQRNLLLKVSWLSVIVFVSEKFNKTIEFFLLWSITLQ